MKLYKTIPTALISGLLVLSLAACEKEPEEKAADAIEEAASDIAESAEDAAEALKDKMDN
ncbi:MAG: hypothetical protein QNJ78_11770 [Gammaproteobacteria bacterium]|nr:hypothetical protein [Gammaproteobacteria bacterium]